MSDNCCRECARANIDIEDEWIGELAIRAEYFEVECFRECLVEEADNCNLENLSVREDCENYDRMMPADRKYVELAVLADDLVKLVSD